jgi:hypothetical protein
MSVKRTTINQIIEDAFSFPKIRETATQFGYDIHAGFTPVEFEELSKKVTVYILDLIQNNQNCCVNKAIEQEVRQIAIPLINEKLKTICKIVPPILDSYPHPNTGSLGHWVTSSISRLFGW